MCVETTPHAIGQARPIAPTDAERDTPRSRKREDVRWVFGDGCGRGGCGRVLRRPPRSPSCASAARAEHIVLLVFDRYAADRALQFARVLSCFAFEPALDCVDRLEVEDLEDHI